MQSSCAYRPTPENALPVSMQTAGLAPQPFPSTSPALRPADREQVILEHLPIVRQIARRIRERLPHQVELDDLVSAGVLGLLDAFQKFDPAKNVLFRSYAQHRIRGAILDSLRTLDWSPRHLRRKSRALEEAIHLLTGRLGRSPSDAEIAREAGMTLPQYQHILGELRGLEIGALNVEYAPNSDEEQLDHVPGRPEDDPFFRCMRAELLDRLTGAVQALPERERTVVTLYYHEHMTMSEIARTLGVVDSRISQLHASAVLRLRAALGKLGPGLGPESLRPCQCA